MLKREFRLRQKSEFRTVFAQGKSFPGKYVVVYVTSGACKYAFVASKKVGKAVERNRAKRLMREVIRLHMPLLNKNYQVIAIARPSIKGKSYQDVESSLLQLLQRAKVFRAKQS